MQQGVRAQTPPKRLRGLNTNAPLGRGSGAASPAPAPPPQAAQERAAVEEEEVQMDMNGLPIPIFDVPSAAQAAQMREQHNAYPLNAEQHAQQAQHVQWQQPILAAAHRANAAANGAGSSSSALPHIANAHQHQAGAAAAAAAAEAAGVQAVALQVAAGVQAAALQVAAVPRAAAVAGDGAAAGAAPAVAAAALGRVSQGDAPPQGALDTCLDSFRHGVAGLQGLLSGLVTEAEAERAALRSARAALDAEREAFEGERMRVAQVLSNGEQVALNVGGTQFTTSVTTLRNAPSPSLFSAMFSGRHALNPGADGSIFLDRDGRHFHDVLNYLRDGQLAYPPDGSDYKYLLELRSEAEFYGLAGLVELIDAYPYNITRLQRCTALNQEDSWMYEDGQDEVVLCVDRPCQLLGVGLCGTDSSYTVELEVVHVDSDDFSCEVAHLATASQTFTKADGAICRLMLRRPVQLLPGQHYMLSALIKGQDSFCCEECLETVVAGGVKVQFQCWESPNGTNEARGQFPELMIRAN